MGAAGPAGAEWSHFETEAGSHESARALGSHRHQLAAEGGGGSSPALQFYSSLTSRSQLSSPTVLQFYSSPALQFLDISSPALVLASSSYNYIAIIRGGSRGYLSSPWTSPHLPRNISPALDQLLSTVPSLVPRRKNKKVHMLQFFSSIKMICTH